jgi:hypothetical protein
MDFYQQILNVWQDSKHAAMCFYIRLLNKTGMS